jgi:hypothetical protein
MVKKSMLPLLLLLAGFAGAQTKVFEMTVLGFKFGKMIVNRTVLPDSTEVYTLNASGKATIFWIDFVSQTKQEVRYKYGKLVSAHYTEIENGKVKRWTKIAYDGKEYQVDSYKGKRSFSQAPAFSVASLYFNNAADHKQVFYEAEANFTDLKQTKDKVEFTTSDGQKSVYRFANGELQKMEFHISIATVYMERIG